ncbi:MAG: GTP-binding protein [Oscillospiraceae bacterium]|nr:MAG: GTP-binding protein [Oscillospiraceae bacterium]
MEKAKRRIDQLLEQSIRPSTAVKGIERDRLTEKTKLYVLTGFLGSGKTTVLLRLLEALKGKRVGVIQNEFGKLGIDGTILRNDDIQMVEINRGSIFCSCLKLSFVQALAEMAQQDFDYLFVESSGLGDPSNVEEILEAAKALAGDRYSFQGAICLVDSVNFLDQLEDLETVYRQLKHCHLAVLTKVDLVDGERICALKAKIREINPKCRIDVSSHGNLNLGFLEENLMQYQWAEGEETTNSEEAKPKTLVLQFEGEVEQEKLERFLAEIEADLYRAKGFFHLKGQGWNQVDLVGQQVDCTPCEEKEISQMVLISKIGPAVIKKIFSAWESQVGLPMQLKN